MKIYYEKDNPELHQHFHRCSVVNEQGVRVFPESICAIDNIKPFDRMPLLSEQSIGNIEKDAKQFEGTSFGEMYKRDNSLARKILSENSEALVSYKI